MIDGDLLDQLDISRQAAHLARIHRDMCDYRDTRYTRACQDGDVIIALPRWAWTWIDAQPFDELPFWIRLALRPDLYKST